MWPTPNDRRGGGGAPPASPMGALGGPDSPGALAYQHLGGAEKPAPARERTIVLDHQRTPCTSSGALSSSRASAPGKVATIRVSEVRDRSRQRRSSSSAGSLGRGGQQRPARAERRRGRQRAHERHSPRRRERYGRALGVSARCQSNSHAVGGQEHRVRRRYRQLRSRSASTSEGGEDRLECSGVRLPAVAPPVYGRKTNIPVMAGRLGKSTHGGHSPARTATNRATGSPARGANLDARSREKQPDSGRAWAACSPLPPACWQR